MFAILAAVAFLIALIFHIAAGNVARYVLDAELIGLILLSIHAVRPWYPWRRPPA